LEYEKLERRLGRISYVSVIAVVASAFGALLMFVIGAVKVVRAYQTYFAENPFALSATAKGANAAITYLVQAIDAFLIAIVLMIFGGGIYNLFIHAVSERQRHLFGIRSIAHLKSLLAELVIVILMVKFLEEALHSSGSYGWDILILPVSVILFAVAVRVLRLRGDSHCRTPDLAPKSMRLDRLEHEPQVGAGIDSLLGVETVAQRGERLL
jgi:uncharacterized membrane protein YqhA